MLCSEVMKTDVECVSPNTSVREAARKMRDNNVGFLPVCDGHMRVLGTVTDRCATRGSSWRSTRNRASCASIATAGSKA